MQEAREGIVRRGYRCWELMPAPSPLDKGQLSPGTKMRALTGARYERVNYTSGNTPREKDVQIYTRLWTQKSSGGITLKLCLKIRHSKKLVK